MIILSIVSLPLGMCSKYRANASIAKEIKESGKNISQQYNVCPEEGKNW